MAPIAAVIAEPPAEPEYAPIRDDAAATAAIARIGVIDREKATIETAKAKAVAEATEKAEGKVTPLQAERDRLHASVEAWCTLERPRLTGGGKQKTVEFPSGEVNWRQGPETIELDETPKGKERILAELYKMRGGKRFIKVTETPSRQNMKAATADEKVLLGKIRGITFVPGSESFSIKPAGAELAERPEPASDQ